MDRRGFLTAGAVLSVPLAGGCPGSVRTGPSENSAVADPSMPEARPPTRGESDVDLRVREVEDDEDVEYVAGDDAVRYVAGWRHTNHEAVTEGAPPEREPFFETAPFERWGETQCLTAAARAAAAHVNDELDTDEVGGGITAPIEGGGRDAIVSVEAVLDRDGTVVHEPGIEFEALVAATPATVEATYVLGEHEYELDAPVYAKYSVLRYD